MSFSSVHFHVFTLFCESDDVKLHVADAVGLQVTPQLEQSHNRLVSVASLWKPLLQNSLNQTREHWKNTSVNLPHTHHREPCTRSCCFTRVCSVTQHTGVQCRQRAHERFSRDAVQTAVPHTPFPQRHDSTTQVQLWYHWKSR